VTIYPEKRRKHMGGRKNGQQGQLVEDVKGADLVDKIEIVQ